MKSPKSFTKVWLSLALAILFAFGSLPISADAQTRYPKRSSRPVYNSYTVRANTVIRVQMNDELSSERANVGDTFSATVTDPIYSGRTEIIPRGSTVYGRVETVNRAQRKGKPGTIGVVFESIELPNGETRAINGSLISTEDLKNVDDEGQLEGRSAIKRNVIFIGAGTGIGAAIGAITGGGKGAAIGAAIGAGLGTGGALLTRGQEVKVKEGTDFGVILNRSVTLNGYR